MQKYSSELIREIRDLRALGYSYGEINISVKRKIPKSTLAEWCKTVELPQEYQKRIAELNITNLNRGRYIALELNRIRRQNYITAINEVNDTIAKAIHEPLAGKIALAMLCLGEASKSYTKSQCFSLGSSDPRIIVIFLELLKRYYNFDLEKVRCTVQCRADQDIALLEEYWRNATRIPMRLFYKARIDPRTLGKPTKNSEYKGVLRVDYLDRKVQLQLESLAQLVYTHLIVQKDTTY